MHGGESQETSCRCTSTYLHCAPLSKVLPGGNIGLNVTLVYPALLLDSQERIKKEVLSLLWNIQMQVPIKSQSFCANPKKR